MYQSGLAAKEDAAKRAEVGTPISKCDVVAFVYLSWINGRNIQCIVCLN